MTKKTPAPPNRPRWQSLLGTGILLLVALFAYLRTGSVPDELLEGALGTPTVTVSATAEVPVAEAPVAEAPIKESPIADTPAPDTPTTVAIIEPTATETGTETGTETATTAPTAEPTGTPTATLTATEQPAETATATSTPVPTRQPTATSTATQPPTRAPPTATAAPTRIRSQSGLPYILYDDLPPEAKETIQLIDNNGPFPFRQDDSTFQNRERILPIQPFDWYREFTVITPGARNRGARRIVEGEDGLLFYTEDHYDSFREVIR